MQFFYCVKPLKFCYYNYSQHNVLGLGHFVNIFAAIAVFTRVDLNE